MTKSTEFLLLLPISEEKSSIKPCNFELKNVFLKVILIVLCNSLSGFSTDPPCAPLERAFGLVSLQKFTCLGNIKKCLNIHVYVLPRYTSTLALWFASLCAHSTVQITIGS